MDDTERSYQRLVEKRKACHRCSGLRNASVIREGEFDSTELGPSTRWLGDRSPRVMVIGQDWGDEHAFKKQGGVDLKQSATNRMLRELLHSIGIVISQAPESTAGSQVFLTNAVLCFKTGGCLSELRQEWFDSCGKEFLRPQVELLRPRVVVTLGERAFRALLDAYQIEQPASFGDAVSGPGMPLPGGARVFAVYHCGQRTLSSHREMDAQFQDWQRIKVFLDTPGRARRVAAPVRPMLPVTDARAALAQGMRRPSGFARADSGCGRENQAHR